MPSPAGLVDDWELQVQPAEALAGRKNQHRELEVLIQWLGMTDFESFKGAVEGIKLSFPSFHLEDKVVGQEGGYCKRPYH